jgi:hypothetical protein
MVKYDNIYPEVWNRIKCNSLILSHTGIGPQIYDITEHPHTITYQYVNTFHGGMQYLRLSGLRCWNGLSKNRPENG